MSSTLTNTCDSCAPSEAYNPKKGYVQRDSGSFGGVSNPLEEELKDIEQVQKTYSLLPIVSFFDKSDATLKVFRMLKDMSPTQGACVGDIARYVLGGEISITAKKEEGLSVSEFDNYGVVSKTEYDAMKNFIKTLNPEFEKRGFLNLLNTAKSVFQNKKTYGNAFLRLNMVQIGRSKYAYIESIDAEKCRYWATSPGEPREIVISNLWNYDYIMRNPPEIIGVYPNITDMGNGVFSTIFHDFEKTTGRDWYGQPDSTASIYWQYAEMQQGQYFTEGFAKDFSGRVFIEYVGETEDDKKDFEAAIEDTFTNQASDKKRVVLRMRHPDDDAATVHEFASNTEDKFHKGISELSENGIIKSHSWNKILMGVPIAGKLGLGSEFWDIYEIKNTSLINPLRHETMQSINTALSVADEWINGKATITDIASLGLKDLYQDLINNKKSISG